MSEKIYCGSGRIVQAKFGGIIKISMHRDDINKIVSHMKSEQIEWVNIEMKAKKDPEQGKPTHYLQIDTWKPEPKASQAPDASIEDKSEDDLPF
jgi:hypothetical protein